MLHSSISTRFLLLLLLLVEGSQVIWRLFFMGQVSAVVIVIDDKENISPFLSDKERVHRLRLSTHKKLILPGGRPRKPLADITHLFSCIDPSVVASPAPAPISGKRRALDESTFLADAARRSKSLRMGFR